MKINCKFFKNAILIVMLTLFLSGCGCNGNKDMMEEGIAYGIVYNDYVGRASVKTTNGKVTSISIDEVFLPHTWAVLKETSEETTNTIVIKDITYPEYIKIDEEILKASEYPETSSSTNGAKNQKVMWSNTKITNLHEYLKTESNAKWYYEAVKAKKVYPCDSTGKKLDLSLKTDKYFKSEGGYWDKWSSNIKELTDGMVKNEFKNEPTMTSDSKVAFGNTVTSATLVGYKDYYYLAKKAYDKIPQ